MSDGIMKYSASGIQQLASELTQYKGQLTGQQSDAGTASNTLNGVWDGGGKDAFMAQHKTLMSRLDDVINVLNGGINGVNQALNNAQVADGKVAASF